MKTSKGTSRNVGCMYFVICFVLMILQVVFLTLKWTGVVVWSWLAVLVPTIIVFGLPAVVAIIVVLALIPGAVWKVWKTTKRIEAEAKMYGLERRPGESTSDLKKRLIHRNMLVGNYTRKDIKDMILDKYPAVGSCMISINNHVKTITLVVRRAYTTEPGAGFTDKELCEIATFVAQYVPAPYEIIAKNA